MVGKRRGLLDYIKENDVEEYCALIEKLGIVNRNKETEKYIFCFFGIEFGGLLQMMLSTVVYIFLIDI